MWRPWGYLRCNWTRYQQRTGTQARVPLVDTGPPERDARWHVLRFMTLGAILSVMASAVLLYVTATDTRRLAQLEKTQKKQKAKLIRDISVLKAERAFLSRPERIAKHAKRLGMQPIRGDQIKAPIAPPGQR